MAEITYPTEWQLGKPRGSLKTLPTYYQVTISPPNGKQFTKTFKYRDYKSIEDALKAAKDWQMEISDEYELTRNKIRYLDKDTIEVKLTKDCVMKTDAKNLDLVEKYSLNTKTAKKINKDGNTTIRQYVMCQDNKNAFLFNSLFTNFKIVEYINGDSLDNRLCNLKEFGSIDTKLLIINNEINTKINDNNNITNKELEEFLNLSKKQYEYYLLSLKDNNYKDLPQNKWILGKPAGSIFKKKEEENIINVRVLDINNKLHSKTFNISNYESEIIAMNDAKQWQYETSYKLGMTKNLIKIIDDDIIEVKINNDIIMKTNKIFINFINKIPLFVTFGSSEINYIATNINDSNILFHIIITKFKEYDYEHIKIDHINGNTCDNRLENLRPVNTSLNNINRNDSKYCSFEIGGKKKLHINFEAKLNKKVHHFYYPINDSKIDINNKVKLVDYGKEKGLEFRNKLIKVSQINEQTILNILDEEHINYDYRLFRYMSSILDLALELLNKTICYDFDIYKEKYNQFISDNEINKIHKYYIQKMAYYHNKVINLSHKTNKKYKDRIKTDLIDKILDEVNNIDISKKEPTKIKNIFKIMNK